MDNRAGEGYRAVINLDDAYIYNLEQGFSCVSTFFYYSQTRKLEAFEKKLRENEIHFLLLPIFSLQPYISVFGHVYHVAMEFSHFHFRILELQISQCRPQLY